MYRETVAPIYIRVSHAQPVKAAHGVDDREAEPRRALLLRPLVKALEDMLRVECAPAAAVADAQFMRGNSDRHRRGGSQKSRSCIRCPDHRNPASIGLATTLRHKAHRKSDALFFSPDVPLTRFQLKKNVPLTQHQAQFIKKQHFIIFMHSHFLTFIKPHQHCRNGNFVIKKSIQPNSSFKK